MQYRKFNLSKPRKETLKSGEVKTFWDNIGKLTLFTKDDGSESGIVELVTFNNNIKLNVFPVKPKEPVNDYSQHSIEDDGSQPFQDEEIRVENIPF